MQLCKLYKYFNNVPSYRKECGRKVDIFCTANLASHTAPYSQLKWAMYQILIDQILKLHLTLILFFLPSFFTLVTTSKESVCNAGDLGSIPGWGRSLGERDGNLFQYSCLDNPIDRVALQATGHMVTQRVSHDWSDLASALTHIYTQTYIYN